MATNSRRSSFRHAAALLVCAAAWGTAVVPAAPAPLLYTAIVARHGVRSPTWTADRLRQWSSAAWPDFGVEPGNLTPRGRALIVLLGAYYREALAHEGLGADCANAAHGYVWADSAQRTLETGRAFAETLWPGCGVVTHALDADGKDPLFNAFNAPGLHVDADAMAASIRSRVAASAGSIAALRPAFETLQHVLTNGGASDHHFGDDGWDTTVTASAAGADLAGPLSTASTLSEVMLLEYANGFSGSELGWGRLTPAALRDVLTLHAVYADLARRSPAIAKPRASNLLAHLSWSIEQAVTGRPVDGALGPAGTRVLVIAGHDTTLSNVSGALDLTWHLAGYPADDTPPGGALVFTVRRTGTSDPMVEMRYVAQTSDQMHDATPLSMAVPPASAVVELPACHAEARDGACPWSVFQRIVAEAVDPAFVVRR